MNMATPLLPRRAIFAAGGKAVMGKSYPNIRDSKKRPKRELDGGQSYGKPCVVCGKGTVGAYWIQVSWFRGEDDEARVCAEHWKLPKPEIIKHWLRVEQLTNRKGNDDGN